MIKFYYKTIRDQKASILDEFKVGSWIYVESPDEKEINYLSQSFGLDPGLIGDAVDPYEVPRLEIDSGIVHVFTRLPFKDGNKITTNPILIVLGETFVLTAAPKPLPFMEKFISGKINFNTTQKIKLMLQIFSEITSAYNHFLTEIGRDVRSYVVDIERVTNKNIVQFVLFEAVLNDFLAALVPTNTILNNLLSANFSVKALELYEEDRDLIQDLFLGGGQLIELCKATLKTIVNIRDAYSTIMTNNLNRVIKLFTALTILLTIPMIVSSFYGMNITLPFERHPLAFFGIVLATIVAVGAVLAIFIKKRWL